MFAVAAYRFTALAPSLTRLIRRKFVSCAFGMSGASTFAGDLALLVFVHSCKAARLIAPTCVLSF
jgi:hypothetical protein